MLARENAFPRHECAGCGRSLVYGVDDMPGTDTDIHRLRLEVLPWIAPHEDRSIGFVRYLCNECRAVVQSELEASIARRRGVTLAAQAKSKGLQIDEM